MGIGVEVPGVGGDVVLGFDDGAGGEFEGGGVFDFGDAVEELVGWAGEAGDFAGLAGVEDFVGVAEGFGGFAEGEGGDAGGVEKGRGTEGFLLRPERLDFFARQAGELDGHVGHLDDGFAVGGHEGVGDDVGGSIFGVADFF